MDSLTPNNDCTNNEYNPFVNKNKSAHYNQEQLNYIKELIDLGWTPNQIAKKFDLPKHAGKTIKKRIADNNWVAVNTRNSSLTNLEREQMHQDVLAGLDHQAIADKYHISLESLENRIANNKWVKTKRKTKYTFNENYFDEIATEHQAYWLGFLMADGYILSPRNRMSNSQEQQSFGFSIAMQDIELAEKFKEDLNATNPINICKPSKNNSSFNNTQSCARILLTSQHAVDSLKKWGIVENKTFFCKMPDIPQSLIPAFIRGYSDGDGSISIYESYNAKEKRYEHKIMWQICGTQELLNSIKDFLGKSDLKLYQRWPERNNNNWSLKICGTIQCKKLLDIIYKDATIYLQRKYDKYAEMQGK